MKITLLGNPVAKSRHRCGCIGNRPHSYDPQIKQVMKAISDEMLRCMVFGNGVYSPYNRQITVRYTFVLPVPRSANRGVKNGFLWHFENPSGKPDLDNLIKLYNDCGNDILWSDDAIITNAFATKIYGDKPRVEIDIMENTIKLDKQTQQVLMVFGPEELKEFLRDVSAFWAWPAERVDELVAKREENDKASTLSAAASVLMEFAQKHAENLSKIRKLKKL